MFSLLKKGIARKIAISFSILIFIIVASQQAITYLFMYTTVRNINRNYITSVLKQKNEKLNYFIKNINLFSQTIISNKNIQSLLIGAKDYNLNISDLSHEVGYALTNTIDAIVLVSDSGEVFQESEVELGEYINSNLEHIKHTVSNSNGEMIFFKSHFVSYGSGKHGDYFFFLARKIRNINNFKDLGFMVIAIRESELFESISMDGDLGNFYLIDNDGNIISCKDKELIGTNIYKKFGNEMPNKTINEDSSYVNSDLVFNNILNDTTKWSLVNIVPISEFSSTYVNLQRTLLAVGIAAILVAVYISLIISGKITRPIREMIFSMKSVSAGNLDVQANTDSKDELKELNDVFNKMTRKLQYLIEEVYHKNLHEKEAELKALKAQINPHFLYNTLDTIYWMLIEKDEYEISKLVTKLGEILRYSIKKDNTKVTVGSEIQQIENYLFIQKSRFEDNLEYELHIDECLLECESLSFLIQPFVENAINHGIMESKGKGKVIIKGYSTDNTIIFEIIDDGIGMSQERIKAVLQNTKISSKGTGIGISNVNQRIKYYYGDNYGLAIESQEGAGTKIIIKVPLIK